MTNVSFAERPLARRAPTLSIATLNVERRPSWAEMGNMKALYPISTSESTSSAITHRGSHLLDRGAMSFEIQTSF